MEEVVVGEAEDEGPVVGDGPGQRAGDVVHPRAQPAPRHDDDLNANHFKWIALYYSARHDDDLNVARVASDLARVVLTRWVGAGV